MSSLSALGSTCLLACPLEVDGPIGDNLPSFLMLLLVGWGNFVTAAPAAPPSQMSKRSSSIPAGRTNRAKYRNENQSHQRRKDGRYEIGMGSTEAAVGRTTESVGRTDGRLDPPGRSRRRLESLWRKKVLLPSSFLSFSSFSLSLGPVNHLFLASVFTTPKLMCRPSFCGCLT